VSSFFLLCLYTSIHHQCTIYKNRTLFCFPSILLPDFLWHNCPTFYQRCKSNDLLAELKTTRVNLTFYVCPRVIYVGVRIFHLRLFFFFAQEKFFTPNFERLQFLSFYFFVFCLEKQAIPNFQIKNKIRTWWVEFCNKSRMHDLFYLFRVLIAPLFIRL
jgi:hypothetical protein